MNVKETPNSTYLQKIEKIANTPFDLIQAEEKYYATIGKYLITPPLNTEDEVLTFIEQNMWHIVMSCIAAYDIGKSIKITENKKEQGL